VIARRPLRRERPITITKPVDTEQLLSLAESMAVPIAKSRPHTGARPDQQEFKPDLERIEIELLLEGIFRHYGFDFRAYAYA